MGNHRLKYGLKKLLKVLIAVAVLYSLMIPILYFMYKNNRGFDWWSILDGNPAVPPEYRTYVIQNNLPFAPDFDIWKVTKALPFAVLGPLILLLFYMTLMVMQFVAIFWFLARGRTYTLYPGEYDVGFDDVRGQPEIVASTKEALTLFQGFKKFREAGGYPPHGILFEGPPGTGKTLLGKAIAGSAKVPFLYASGSSFNNMFMGVGNLRIARLFKKARKMSHKYGGAVIFIDELDAVGGTRGSVSAIRAGGLEPLEPPKIIMGGLGAGGASMYVNELLIQMDGITMARGLGRHMRRLFHLKPKVPQYNLMVIGATNQAATLDPALLRAGRFDRKLHVGLPSGAGREDILVYYLNKVPHEPVDTGRLARATQGFSPAQIKNLVNEGLIFALMDGRDKLNFNDLWDAKVTEELGLKEPDYSSAREKQMTAFHEAGHAVVGYVLRLDEQIQVASIIKRGRALGVVYSTPIEESQSKLREDIQRDIAMFMGGLAAEEIWFGQTTTGPSADLRNATRLAVQMLGLFGMGDDYISYGVIQDTYKGGTVEWVMDDPERRRAIGALLAECKREAVEILRRNEPAVRALAERLLEKGEVLGEEVEEIMKAKGVARSTPTFRPVLELTEADWHPPALLDASQREVGNGRPPEPRPPAEPPPRTGPAAREADDGFEW